MHDVAIIGAGIAGMAPPRACKRGLLDHRLRGARPARRLRGILPAQRLRLRRGRDDAGGFRARRRRRRTSPVHRYAAAGRRELPGYVAWLPDRVVTLHRDHAVWAGERLRALGDTSTHRAFWRLLDQLAAVFWRASRNGVKLPIQNLGDLTRAVTLLGARDLPLARYLTWTLGDALRAYHLRDDAPLCGLLSMLVEDTTHNSLDDAPLINAALGITIRGAGLTRARGGMWGFWRRFRAHYQEMGGVLRVGCAVERIEGQYGDFKI